MPMLDLMNQLLCLPAQLMVELHRQLFLLIMTISQSLKRLLNPKTRFYRQTYPVILVLSTAHALVETTRAPQFAPGEATW